MAGEIFHSGFIAEDGSAAHSGRGIDRKHRDLVALLDQGQTEGFDETRFADAGSTRNADPNRFAAMGQERRQQGFRFHAVVGARRFGQSDGASEGTPIAADNVCRQVCQFRRRLSLKVFYAVVSFCL